MSSDREKTVRKKVPAPIEREVWIRADACCEYPGCDSRFRLELDHRTPVARGGDHAVENLRLYCRVHNQLAAVKEFGLKHMREYVPVLGG